MARPAGAHAYAYMYADAPDCAHQHGTILLPFGGSAMNPDWRLQDTPFVDSIDSNDNI